MLNLLWNTDTQENPPLCRCGGEDWTERKHGGPDRYRAQTDCGYAAVAEYQVFPGVWLSYQDAYTYADYLAADPGELLEITHCQGGILEYEAEHRAFCLGAGDMVVFKRGKGRALCRYPIGYFHGISILVHPETAPKSGLLRDVNVDLPALFRKFDAPEACCILRAAAAVEHLFSGLYTVPEFVRRDYCKVKVLELLLFLSYQDPRRPQKASAPSKDQALLRRIFAYVRTHPNERWTIEKLAAQFQVSSEQLQRSAKRVFGKPFYQCIRTYKMHLAAAQLLDSTRSVTEIASEFGYDNSSKFAGAFQSVFGCSPTEYRAAGGPEK